MTDYKDEGGQGITAVRILTVAGQVQAVEGTAHSGTAGANAKPVVIGGYSLGDYGRPRVANLGIPADAIIPDSNGHALAVLGYNSLYNGVSWDRQRGNEADVALLASAARTVETDSPLQTNFNGRGALIWVTVTVAGTGTLTVRLRAPTLAWTFHDFATITGSTAFLVYPGISAGSGQRVSATLPRTWGVKVTPSDASSWTYSINAQTLV